MTIETLQAVLGCRAPRAHAGIRTQAEILLCIRIRQHTVQHTNTLYIASTCTLKQYCVYGFGVSHSRWESEAFSALDNCRVRFAFDSFQVFAYVDLLD